MDYLLIASDPTKVGLETAARIKGMAEEMDLVKGKVVLALSGVPESIPDYLEEMLADLPFENVHTVRRDEGVFEMNARGVPLLQLPEDSPAYLDILKMIERFGI